MMNEFEAQIKAAVLPGPVNASTCCKSKPKLLAPSSLKPCTKKADEVNKVNDVWLEPTPFDDLSFLPDFPLDALSGIGRETVETISKVNQVDPALTASLYLGVLSACCAKKVKVDLISHREPVNLYPCSIYDSGNRKSSTVGEIARPLYEYQRVRQEDLMATIRDAHNTFRIKENRLVKLQKKAAAEDDPQKRQQYETEAADVAREIAENPVPTVPVFLVDDVTPEKLGVLMAENGERMAVISSESGILEIMAGRYSKDGVGNIDLFLKAHAGDYWANHRIGRDAQSMEAPTLTLCLSIQSGVIEDIGKNAQFCRKGLLARFLYALCKSQVGYRQRQTLSMPESLRERYKNHIFSLMDIPFEDTNLTLSPDAQRVWDTFYDDIERELRPGESFQFLTDWGSKLPGAVARIAGLLHLAEYGARGLSIPISVNCVTASCMIGAYFKEHALAVFGLMQEDRQIKLARQILEYIKRSKSETFKGRDVIHHTAIKLMENVEQGIKVLIERGHIRPDQSEAERVARRGRPEAGAYLVHPAILRGENV